MAIFHPNCTLPAERVPIVSAPNVRGTLSGILWPSIATLIACTYSALHLNVPEQRLGQEKESKHDLKWTLLRLQIGLQWFCINLLAPEIVLAKPLLITMALTKN